MAKFPQPGVSRGSAGQTAPWERGLRERLLRSAGAGLQAEAILQSANADHSQIRNVKFGHASGIIVA